MFHKLWFLLLCPGLPLACLIAWIYWHVRKRDERFKRPFLEMSRPAGWSLQKRTEGLMENITMDMMMSMLCGVFAWAIWLANEIQLMTALVIGLVSCSFFVFRIARTLRTCANHRLGLHGEQVVGLILDRLSSDSVHVFHDLEVKESGKKPWNIDHVILSPAGVFAIETKTRRKSRGISADGQHGHKVIFDGQQLIFPAPMKADRYGLEQARGNANWLADKLTALNGCPIAVTPVLVLPGWWIDAKGKGPVIVLNPKGLATCITGRPTVLSPVQMRAINAQLDERCRIDLTQ